MLRDFKEAVRSLASTPGPVIVIVITLALAIGANTAIFSVLNGVLLRPLGYPAQEELVVIWENNVSQDIYESQTSSADYRDWRERAQSSFDGQIALYQHFGYTLTEGDRPERIAAVKVSPGLFRVLGVAPRLGRIFTDEEEEPGNERLLVLSHASWENRFGSDPGVIDSTIMFDGEPFLIVGVMPSGFTFPPGDNETEVWSPVTLGPEVQGGRPHRFYNAVARTAPGVSLAEAQEELSAVAAQIATEHPGSNEGWGVDLVPIHTQVVGDIGATLWVLFGAVFLVLLIGCVNIANLLVARSIASSKEYVIRAALGARRWPLVRRSLADSLVLAALGGLAGLLVAYWGVGVLRTVIPSTVPRAADLSIDLSVLLFAAVVSLASGIGFGLLPAIRVMTPNLAHALSSNGRGFSVSRRSRRVSDLMIVIEVALAIILLVGAGLMVRSYQRLSDVDPGYRTDNVISVAVSLPRERYVGGESQKQFFAEVARLTAALPAVEAAGAVTRLPMSSTGVDFEMPFTVVGLDAQSPTERPRADYRGVIPGYLEAMGIPLVRGRLLDQFDGQEGRQVALVNEALVERYFPDVDPLGQVLAMPMAGELEIVGVVGDIRHGGLEAQPKPELYVPYEQLPLSEMHVVVYSREDPTRVATAVADVIATVDPLVAPSEVVSISDLLWESIAQPRFNMALLVALAFCAAVLAAVGIYGVVSHSVVRRTGEIGVRMALGADASRTVGLVVREALVVVVIGVVLGIFGALGTGRFVEGLLYGVAPTDAVTFFVVGLLIVSIGALAALIPARRAARVDPVVALRED